MRAFSVLVGLAALGFAHSAVAAPVSLAPVSFSTEMQTDLEEDYGQREAAELEGLVRDAVSAELTRRGAIVGPGAPLTVEISVIDARPNRPTMQQLAARPGLDPIRSISLGGAELVAVIRGADGEIITEVRHRRFDYDLRDVTAATSTWAGARRAIRQFAVKIADAVTAI